MKKTLAFLLAAFMSVSALSSCGQNETTDKVSVTEQNDADIVKICFDDYTKNFGKNFETVSEYYSDIGELEGNGGWLGTLWYSLPNDDSFGFSIDEYGGVLKAANVPFAKIYPELGEKSIISKAEFEEYIGQKTELVPLSDDSEFSSEFLTYKHNNLDVLVFCDSAGNIDCADTNCMFVEK